MLRLLIGMMVLVNCLIFAGGASAEDWDKIFGGTSVDNGRGVQQTTDGGYIVVGYTNAYDADLTQIWLIKTDASGNKLWDKKFGGTSYEMAESVQQTSDGGYIILGYTRSYGAGQYDFWLIKTDSLGNMLWDKTFGGAAQDFAKSVSQTSDGGFILTGYTYSFGAGEADAWLIKTDSSGNKEWDETFGGTRSDAASAVQETSDAGYVLAGSTWSYGAGADDVWLVKTDSSGNKLWDKTYGSAPMDFGMDVQQTSDGGYIIAANTDSYGAGDRDFWLIKTDSSGSVEWDATFGAASDDVAASLDQTSDGGYIMAGWTRSFGAGDDDVYLVRSDGSGNLLWEKTFGTDDNEEGYCVQQTADGDYIVVGDNPTSAALYDIWLIKTSDPLALSAIHLLYPPDGFPIESAPEFGWSPEGGRNDVFAVDVSLTPDFAKYYSTYDSLHRLTHDTSWTMPLAVWNKIPNGKTVYWRVRGADLVVAPPDIITSSEVWSFYKP